MGGEKKKILPTVIMLIFGVIFVMPILLLVKIGRASCRERVSSPV